MKVDMVEVAEEQTPVGLHEIRRIRREKQKRECSVDKVESISPRMVRIHLRAHSLKNFSSSAFDDHVKVFFPSDGEPAMRDFTPRLFDPTIGHLAIDFALHESGPASDWARQAQAGQSLEIGGPRGSTIIPDDFDWYLMIGDQTALPAISRRLEEIRPDVPITTIVLLEDELEIQPIRSQGNWSATWVCKNRVSSDVDAQMLAKVKDFSVPRGDGHIWIAAEASLTATLKAYLLNEVRHPTEWIKASGYWQK